MTSRNPQENNSGRGQGSSQRQNSDLSNAARIMRTSTNPEERRKAARLMGKRGGEHSHGGGRPAGSTNKK